MRQDGPPDLQVLAQCRAGLSPLKCRTLRHGAACPADPVVYCCAARGGWYVHRTDSRWGRVARPTVPGPRGVGAAGWLLSGPLPPRLPVAW